DASTVTGTVSDNHPVITSLSISPNPVAPAKTLKLTANGVSDPDGTIAKVEFYRDSNGNNVLDVDTDANLGTDTDAAGGWSVDASTTGFPLGTNRYFA